MYHLEFLVKEMRSSLTLNTEKVGLVAKAEVNVYNNNENNNYLLVLIISHFEVRY